MNVCGGGGVHCALKWKTFPQTLKISFEFITNTAGVSEPKHVGNNFDFFLFLGHEVPS